MRLNLGSNRMKNVIRISAGTMLGQVIMFVSLPILTRIYGASTIGVSSFLLALASLVNAVSDGGFTNVLMIEEDENKSRTTYQTITTISILISGVAAIGVTVYDILFFLHIYQSSGFILLYTFVLFFTSKQIMICYTWLNKKGLYEVLMLNPIINYGSYSIVAFLLGVLGYKQYGYYIGYMIGQMITVIHMKRYLPKTTYRLSLDSIESLYKEHKLFFCFELPTNFLSQIKNQMPTLLIKGFFGNEILGYYSIANKLINIPITLLANAMGRVFFQVGARFRNDMKKIGQFTYRNMNKAMNLAVIPTILLLTFGDVAIHLMYGDGYEKAGVILRIVAVQGFITFLSLTVQGITTLINKQKYTMIWLILQTLFSMVLFVIGAGIFRSIDTALALMTIVTCISYVIYYSFIYELLGIDWSRFLIRMIITIVILWIVSYLLRMMLEPTGLYDIKL